MRGAQCQLLPSNRRLPAYLNPPSQTITANPLSTFASPQKFNSTLNKSTITIHHYVPVRREVISGNCCSRAFARLAVWYAALRKPRGSVRTPSNPKGPGQRVPLLGEEHARGRTRARGSAEACGVPQAAPLRRPSAFVRRHAHEAAVPESSPRRARALVRSRPRAHRIARAGRRRPRRGARRVLEACGEGRTAVRA